MINIAKIELELDELAARIRVLSSSRDKSSELDELIADLKAEVRVREISIAYLDLG